jgi:hypothetical protein
MVEYLYAGIVTQGIPAPLGPSLLIFWKLREEDSSLLQRSVTAEHEDDSIRLWTSYSSRRWYSATPSPSLQAHMFTQYTGFGTAALPVSS